MSVIDAIRHSGKVGQEKVGNVSQFKTLQLLFHYKEKMQWNPTPAFPDVRASRLLRFVPRTECNTFLIVAFAQLSLLRSYAAFDCRRPTENKLRSAVQHCQTKSQESPMHSRALRGKKVTGRS